VLKIFYGKQARHCRSEKQIPPPQGAQERVLRVGMTVGERARATDTQIGVTVGKRSWTR